MSEWREKCDEIEAAAGEAPNPLGPEWKGEKERALIDLLDPDTRYAIIAMDYAPRLARFSKSVSTDLASALVLHGETRESAEGHVARLWEESKR